MSYLTHTILGQSPRALETTDRDGSLHWSSVIAALCLAWYGFIVLVSSTGCIQLYFSARFLSFTLDMELNIDRYRYYSSPPRPARSPTLPINKVPHVTILRPVKGHDPYLYECLAATFHQTYPREKLTIYFCIASRTDGALSTLKLLLADFPEYNARIFVEDEDSVTNGALKQMHLGPNPKIRNLSRGYREAKGNIVWIIDCNVWVGKGVTGRMVDKLCGLGPSGQYAKKYKFVHQLPMVIDVGARNHQGSYQQPADAASFQHRGGSTIEQEVINSSNFWGKLWSIWHRAGGRLEELFMSSAHAKFYTAINTVLVAPCIVGKSNMFRKSHLDYLTTSDPARPPGIDFFSNNICEDHLIGDLLWKRKVPGVYGGGEWGKHALLFGDLAIQPMAEMSVEDYVSRRVRWLRVRKFTVTLATLVEPGTESFLCSLYGAYGITSLPYLGKTLHIPQSWTAFAVLWLLSITCWAAVDWCIYLMLHSGRSIEIDQNTPSFVRPSSPSRRPFKQWILAWLGREALAFPIWAWAVFGGTAVVWRGKRLWVGMDMRVHEYEKGSGHMNGVGRVHNRIKERED